MFIWSVVENIESDALTISRGLGDGTRLHNSVI